MGTEERQVLSWRRGGGEDDYRTRSGRVLACKVRAVILRHWGIPFLFGGAGGGEESLSTEGGRYSICFLFHSHFQLQCSVNVFVPSLPFTVVRFN